MFIAGKEDQLRLEGSKVPLDLHLHCIAFKNAEHVAEWHIAAEVVEECSRVMVVAIKPFPAGTDGADPKIVFILCTQFSGSS